MATTNILSTCVRIPLADLAWAVTISHKLGLVMTTVYAAGDGTEELDVACRKSGPRGNHEPMWTERERLAFIRRIND